MKLLGSTENKSSKNVPHLEITELISFHYKTVSNDFQQHSRVLYRFAMNRPFVSLLEISRKNRVFLKTFNLEFQAIEVWFTDLIIKIRYSIEPGGVKGYGFLLIAKIISKNGTKVAKSMSNKYSQKRLDSAKKSSTDAIKTTSKRVIRKTAEATGNLIGDKIPDKATNVSTELHPKYPKEFHSQNSDANNEIEVQKERYISPEKRQQIIE